MYDRQYQNRAQNWMIMHTRVRAVIFHCKREMGRECDEVTAVMSAARGGDLPRAQP